MEKDGLGSEGDIASKLSVIVLTIQLPSMMVLLSQMASPKTCDPVWESITDAELDWASNSMERDRLGSEGDNSSKVSVIVWLAPVFLSTARQAED